MSFKNVCHILETAKVILINFCVNTFALVIFRHVKTGQNGAVGVGFQLHLMSDERYPYL